MLKQVFVLEQQRLASTGGLMGQGCLMSVQRLLVVMVLAGLSAAVMVRRGRRARLQGG